MIEAAFETARRLFGLTFTPADVPLYHPDARAWEVKDDEGIHVGLFIGDYFARASKHSGAWMTSLRDQENLAGDIAAELSSTSAISPSRSQESRHCSHSTTRVRCSTNSATPCTASCPM